MHGNVVMGVDMVQFKETSEKTVELPINKELSKFGFDLYDASLPKADTIEGPVLPILKSVKDIGFLNLIPDLYGTIIGVNPFYRFKDKIYSSFSISLFLHHLGLSYDSLSFSDGEVRISGKNINFKIPVDEKNVMWIDFAGTIEDVTTYSLIDVIASAEKISTVDLDLTIFKDKIVIVGQTASATGDHGSIPISHNSPLVMVHANSIHNLINQNVLTKINLVVNCLITLLAGIFISLITAFLRIKSATFFCLILCITFGYANQFLFMQYVLVDIFSPISAITLSFICVIILNYYVRDSDVRILKDAFSSFVSPGVMRAILNNPEQINLGGSKQSLSVLFSDIEGYTSLSNSLKPNEILELLREYLDSMTQIVLGHDGTIDKIMGDGIMAFFGAPVSFDNHTEKAVLTALKMQKSVNSLVTKWESEGKSSMQIRVGIATGDVFVGNIGSKQHLEYTVLGPTVNLASRLETKAEPGKILISEETYNIIKNDFICFKSEGLSLKGYSKEYFPYYVVGKTGELSEEEIEKNKAYFGGVKDIIGDKFVKFSSDFLEKRISKRQTLDMDIQYEYKGRLYSTKCLNISNTGILTCPLDENCIDIKKGDEIVYVFNLHTDSGKMPLKIVGNVTRFEENTETKERGFACKFSFLWANSVESISYFTQRFFNNLHFNPDYLENTENIDFKYRFNFKNLIKSNLTDSEKSNYSIDSSYQNLLLEQFLFKDKKPKVYKKHLIEDRLNHEILIAKRNKQFITIFDFQLQLPDTIFGPKDGKGQLDTYRLVLLIFDHCLRITDIIFEQDTLSCLMIALDCDNQGAEIILSRMKPRIEKWINSMELDCEISYYIKRLTIPPDKDKVDLKEIFKELKIENG